MEQCYTNTFRISPHSFTKCSINTSSFQHFNMFKNIMHNTLRPIGLGPYLVQSGGLTLLSRIRSDQISLALQISITFGLHYLSSEQSFGNDHSVWNEKV